MRNSGKRWSGNEEKYLIELAGRKLSLSEICLKLGRTPGSVRSKAQALGVSLKVANNSDG